MLRELAQRAPVHDIDWPAWRAHGVAVSLWRLDALDAAGSGNKLFKLAENFHAARAAGHSRILSFGGAFSNHLHALALSGRAAGFETVGIIRGEAVDNPTLRDAAAAGMHLHFVDRESYRLLTQPVLIESAEQRRDALWRALEQRFGRCYVVPEGGANRLGARGCRVLGEALAQRANRPDLVVLPAATGSTLAGLVAGLDNRVPALGVAVLKGGSFIAEQVREYLRQIDASHCTQWRIELDHHAGGYARVPDALRAFVDAFVARTGIGIEPIYSGKMLYAINQLIERGEFSAGTRILAVHTGGMQGARSASV